MVASAKQEFLIKCIRKKQERDSEIIHTCNSKCRLYQTAVEDVVHVIWNHLEISLR